MRRLLVPLSLLLSLLLSGHALAQAPAGTPTLLAATDETLRQVSAVRGLKVKAPIARGVLSRAQIGEKLRARVDEEYSKGEIAAETRVLRRLGLLPMSLDYKQLLIDLLMEQVAGFYDPKQKRLYIADWLPMEMQRPAIAHELEHALQDQHFDLLALTKPLKDDGDRQLARAALVEGDGTALMIELQAQALRVPSEQLPDLVLQMADQLIHSGGMGQTPLFDKAPAFVRETLMFPYFEGLRFVMALRRGKPWKRIDEVFHAPPESTEQILHPERYLAGEAPVRVDAGPIAALAPKKELRRDVLGELVLRVLFRSRLPEPQSDQAAAGWGGDRLVAYGDDKTDSLPVVIDLSVWDTELDATEAAQAFRALIGKITGSKPTVEGKLARFVDPNGEAWRVEQRGDKVLCILGAPVADEAIAAEAWQKLHVTAPAAGRAASDGR